MKSGNQTRRGAIVEQAFNVGSGFLISLIVFHYFLRPALHSGFLTPDNSITITLIFTVISVIRGYVWRRIFTRK